MGQWWRHTTTVLGKGKTAENRSMTAVRERRTDCREARKFGLAGGFSPAKFSSQLDQTRVEFEATLILNT